jgi:hypothetical protein
MSKTYSIEKYSEAAFGVFGDTEQIRNILEALGGKENANLRGKDNTSRRHGWIFPNGMMSTVTEACASGVIPPKYKPKTLTSYTPVTSNPLFQQALRQQPFVSDAAPVNQPPPASSSNANPTNDALQAEVKELKKQVHGLLKQMDALQCDVSALTKIVTKNASPSSVLSKGHDKKHQEEKDSHESEDDEQDVDYGDCDPDDVAFYTATQSVQSSRPVTAPSTKTAKAETADKKPRTRAPPKSAASTRAQPASETGGSLLKRKPNM